MVSCYDLVTTFSPITDPNIFQQYLSPAAGAVSRELIRRRGSVITEINIIKSAYVDSARDGAPDTTALKHRFIAFIKATEVFFQGVGQFHSFHTVHLEIYRPEGSPV